MGHYEGDNPRINHKVLLDRSVDQLIGICAGISADGVLNDQELSFLATWLRENEAATKIFPGNQIVRRLLEILADGRITDDERADLLETLKQVSGNHFSETGAAAAEVSDIPYDAQRSMTFSGNHFCFTGKFAFGTRNKCKESVVALGAVCDDNLTMQTDYLVIGSFTSPNWRHESYGRKIERAMELRAGGNTIPMVVKEQDWVSALGLHDGIR